MIRNCCFIVALLTVIPARADHDTAQTILSPKRFAQVHVLQPARKPRELSPAADRQAAERAERDAKFFLNSTLSVVLLSNDEILYEDYANGASRKSLMRSYSVAKSLTALAVGEALCAGKIKSLEDKAAAYATVLEGTAYGAATIRQLLMYTSGAEDPGGDGYTGIHSMSDYRAMLEYKFSLTDLMRKYGGASRSRPGERFIYNGLDSAALSVVMRSATGMPMPRWFEETVWQKAGAESAAEWYVDKDGNGIGDLGFFATTRDFARIGLYILERLNGKADDACGAAFLRDAAAPHISKGYWNSAPTWGLGLHVGADGNTWLFGHGGQRVGINVKMGRVFATNGFKGWRDYDIHVQGILSR